MTAKYDAEKHSIVGVIATSFHSDFSRMVVSNICDVFKDDNVEIHLYLGVDPGRYLSDNSTDNFGLDIHYYSIFGYSSFDDLDLLIISGEAIYTEHMAPKLDDIMKKLPDVPTIVFSSNEYEKAIHINVDNYNGLKGIISHLVFARGLKRIAFVSGKEYIPDSAQRLKAYKDCVKEFDLDDDPNLIVYGNFTSKCDDDIRPLLSLDPLPEAIVCSNDEMAVSAYRVIREKGLKVGKDIAVTGFDDIQVAKAMHPPLTTVRQKFEDIAYTVAHVASKMVHGEHVEDQLLTATPIIRASCGSEYVSRVDSEKDDENPDEVQSYLLSEYRDHKSSHLKEMRASMLLRSLLIQPVSIESFFNILGDELKRIGITTSMVTLLETPKKVYRDEMMYVPEKQSVVFLMNDDGVFVSDMKNAPVLYTDHDREKKDARSRNIHRFSGVFCTYLLFFGDIQYGAWTVKVELQDVLFCYLLSLDLGSALRYMYLALDQQEAHRKLELQNQILDFSASHDEMTGLYNRAGLLKHCYEYMADNPDAEEFVAVMADLDHLKQINDTFGHEGGDYAIYSAGNILNTSFPKGAAIGRTGGDEFMGIFVPDSKTDEVTFPETVRAACEALNTTNDKPFYVELSVGCSRFNRENIEEGLTEIFKESDRFLYDAKKKRRASVIKEKR